MIVLFVIGTAVLILLTIGIIVCVTMFLAGAFYERAYFAGMALISLFGALSVALTVAWLGWHSVFMRYLNG